jgi:hypothetical protein
MITGFPRVVATGNSSPMYGNAVTPCRRQSSQNADTLSLRRIRSAAPVLTTAPQPMDSAMLWKNGSGTYTTSPGCRSRKMRPAVSAAFSQRMWLITEALGRPVVPEVGIVNTRSPRVTRPVLRGLCTGAQRASSTRSTQPTGHPTPSEASSPTNRGGPGTALRTTADTPRSSAPTTTVRAPRTFRLCFRGSPRSVVFKRPACAPILASATSANSSSGRDSTRSATQSPRRIPRAVRVWAHRFAAAFSSRHVHC